MAESLTLLIPVYNGGAFLARSLERAIEFLGSMDRRAELLVIDDGSTDETPRILSACRSDVLRVLRNERNRGKGHAVRRGLLQAKGTWDAPSALLGGAAVLLATINIAGGFLVTQRMLKMFQK